MRSSGKVSPDAKWKFGATYSPSKCLEGSGASAADAGRGAAMIAELAAAAMMAAATRAGVAKGLRAGIGFLSSYWASKYSPMVPRPRALNKYKKGPVTEAGAGNGSRSLARYGVACI